MEHSLSERRMAPMGVMVCSMDRALDTDRANLEESTRPESSLLGIVRPDSGVTFDLAHRS